jgi:teichoic acid transport system permease protein
MSLGQTTVEAASAAAAPHSAPSDLAALAAEHGLTVSGTRPTLVAYVRRLWVRRQFIATFSTARLTAQYSQARLGQVWQVLTPLLNATVYYFVFGVLLGTSRGVPDYIPFLVTGVFIWTFTAQAVGVGAKAISGNLGIVRALHFPRAALPIALTPAAAAADALLDGRARRAARAVLVRVWMYLSGVMWSLDKVAGDGKVPHWVYLALKYNPPALFIDLVRFALIDSYTRDQLPVHVWIVVLGWAVLVGVGGLVFFWRAEERYGRG